MSGTGLKYFWTKGCSWLGLALSFLNLGGQSVEFEVEAASGPSECSCSKIDFGGYHKARRCTRLHSFR